jgi:hypothetical protein
MSRRLMPSGARRSPGEREHRHTGYARPAMTWRGRGADAVVRRRPDEELCFAVAKRPLTEAVRRPEEMVRPGALAGRRVVHLADRKRDPFPASLALWELQMRARAIRLPRAETPERLAARCAMRSMTTMHRFPPAARSSLSHGLLGCRDRVRRKAPRLWHGGARRAQTRDRQARWLPPIVPGPLGMIALVQMRA